MSDKKILVLDVGGVRCDSAIIAVRGGMYTILSSHHAHDFAPGELLDKAIYSHFSAEFKKKNKLDTDSDAKAKMKLLLEAESVKKSLSASATANASVESLMEGLDFKSSINRIRFDMLARKVYQQIADFALDAVKKANLEPIDIDDVSCVLQWVTNDRYCSSAVQHLFRNWHLFYKMHSLLPQSSFLRHTTHPN